MLRVNSMRLRLLCTAVAALWLGVAGVAMGADASAPAAAGSAPDAAASAPVPKPGSVQAVMALAAKEAQQQLADKKKKDEEERLRGFGSDWQSWTADNSVADIASLQQGLRDFAGYCRGCHSLKYLRYSRIANDLQITPDQLSKYLLPVGVSASDYVTSPMPSADALIWFGKAPPDLSLIARSRGTDYLYRFLTTFYSDPSRPTGANNLQLASVAMPHVLSTLEGVKVAVFKTVNEPGPGGSVIKEQVFDHFVQVAPGSLSREEYLATVRDLVNFLDYAGEPAQVQRRHLGLKVVLFLLAFTALTYLLKREYWKNVH
jgi:ubiquinol-cytochrome c reductase cytochrome c1 subunit